MILKQGDKVFFSDNGAGITGYSGVAFQTIQALGLTQLVYGGAGLDVKNTNLDREIRDDFYQSKVVVLLLGKGQGWRRIKDNWAIPELTHAISMGIKCLIYITAEVTKEERDSLSLPTETVTVRDESHFETVLRQNLEQLIVAA